MSIEVREMKLSDVDEVLELLKSTFNSYLNVKKEHLIDSFNSKDLFPYVAIYNGEIIGTASLIVYKRLSNGRTAVIEDVVIKEGRHGMGFGKIIVNVLISNALKLGCFKIYAECMKEKIKFYEKCGFSEKSIIVKKY